MSVLIAGLLLGLASSAHCAAMCGPLMLVFRRHAGGAWQVAVYHGARLATYAAFGAVAGTVGRTVALGGFGRGLSVAVGLLLILAAFRKGRGDSSSGGTGWFSRWLRPLLAESRAALTAHPLTGSMVAGMLNAFVPCGLLLAALAAAAIAPTPAWAAASMAAFGVGTSPALVAVWWSAGVLALPRAVRWRLVAPVTLALTGAVLVGRGLLQHEHGTAPSTASAAASGHHAH